MRFDLKGFQDEAARNLRQDLDFARAEVAQGRKQALILSSPTGSGKTVTLAALIERVFTGAEACPALRDAVFLWVSDSPELNAQSRDKLLRASEACPAQRLRVIDSDFDEEFLAPGNVYFLNTQKLGRDRLLTSAGDGRDFTIWRTVANTIEHDPTSFFLIIDEAHRGMAVSPAEQNRAEAIIQRFLLGDSLVGLPAFPIVIGMSATPARFHRFLEGSGRVSRLTEIKPEEVRESGLLKDRIIVFHPESDRPSDLTLLEAAVKQWKQRRYEWESYCRAEGEASIVRPLLVVQVEDAGGDRASRTDLDRVVETIERVAGSLSDEEYAHAFDAAEVVEAGGRRLRHVDPSRIQDEPFVSIVFFKTALSTGWDCPRAEVMMSFRRAVDPTSIAQLVGRIVRSPLARRIESNDLLNAVSLYLPHFDEEALEAVLQYLRRGQSSDALPSMIVSGADMVSYGRAPGSEEAFTALNSIPSYGFEPGPRLSDAKRLLMLGRYLTTLDAIDPGALDEARNALLDVLEAERQAAFGDEQGLARIREAGQIRVRQISIESGRYQTADVAEKFLDATPENIEELFESCDRHLAPREALHTAYWKKFYVHERPIDAKLEFYLLLQEPDVWHAIEDAAREAFGLLFDRNAKKVAALKASKREKYRKLRGRAVEPEAFPITYQPALQLPKRGRALSRHLYADSAGRFFAELNGWETRVLEAELRREDFGFWLRNIDRQSWSLNIPFREGDVWRGFFPDFIVVRRKGRGLLLDILEPHDTSRADVVPKAKALARYADRHASLFGRILMIRFDGDQRREIDLKNVETRKGVLRAQTAQEFDRLF